MRSYLLTAAIFVAIVGALLPAHWASRGPVVQVLRTE